METDVLVGLRFEISGGLGKTAGVVVGKAGGLYLVQREDAQHLELLELSDLKAARFFATNTASPVTSSATTSLGRAASAPLQPVVAATPAAPRTTVGRLSDKIRRSAQADDNSRS